MNYACTLNLHMNVRQDIGRKSKCNNLRSVNGRNSNLRWEESSGRLNIDCIDIVNESRSVIGVLKSIEWSNFGVLWDCSIRDTDRDKITSLMILCHSGTHPGTILWTGSSMEVPNLNLVRRTVIPETRIDDPMLTTSWDSGPQRLEETDTLPFTNSVPRGKEEVQRFCP